MELDETTVARATGWRGNGAQPEPAARHLTELGNAELLVDEHVDDIRFVPGRGWYVWDRRCWKRDDSGELVRRMAASVRRLYTKAGEIADDKERKRLVDHARRSEAEGRMRAAISLAQADLRVISPSHALDADPWLLNLANGTLHLQSGWLGPHNRRQLLTKVAPVAYHPEATAPRWAAFLERIFGGQAETIAFVRRAIGYSLTGLTSEQKLFILHGSGANGKTTFIETLRALFGDYGQQTPVETFLERRDSGIPNDIARLPGARFVAAAEVSEGRRLNETVVKRLTGGDTMTARFMRAEWFEFSPVFKPWLATNHKPEVRGTDLAIWRRISLVPFRVTIPARERDPGLGEALRAELPGILRWALEGCLEWQEAGLGEPEEVRDATAGYRAEMDVLGEFLRERCVLTPDAHVKASDLHRAYLAWCESSGERDRLSQRTLGLKMRERGFEASRSAKAREWRGLGLLLEHDA